MYFVPFVFQALIFFDFMQRCKPDAFSADLLETVLSYIQKICHARYSEHDCALATLKTLYRKYQSVYSQSLRLTRLLLVVKKVLDPK